MQGKCSVCSKEGELRPANLIIADNDRVLNISIRLQVCSSCEKEFFVMAKVFAVKVQTWLDGKELGNGKNNIG